VLANGDTINTWNSASFFIYADDFTAKNITIENNAGFNAGQAVAVFAYGNRIAFKNCNIKGFQDILFCSGSGSKQYYENCYLEGTTDFIFRYLQQYLVSALFTARRILMLQQHLHHEKFHLALCFSIAHSLPTPTSTKYH
jgi:hypothetical protein